MAGPDIAICGTRPTSWPEPEVGGAAVAAASGGSHNDGRGHRTSAPAKGQVGLAKSRALTARAYRGKASGRDAREFAGNARTVPAQPFGIKPRRDKWKQVRVEKVAAEELRRPVGSGARQPRMGRRTPGPKTNEPDDRESAPTTARPTTASGSRAGLSNTSNSVSQSFLSLTRPLEHAAAQAAATADRTATVDALMHWPKTAPPPTGAAEVNGLRVANVAFGTGTAPVSTADSSSQLKPPPKAVAAKKGGGFFLGGAQPTGWVAPQLADDADQIHRMWGSRRFLPMSQRPKVTAAAVAGSRKGVKDGSSRSSHFAVAVMCTKLVHGLSGRSAKGDASHHIAHEGQPPAGSRRPGAQPRESDLPTDATLTAPVISVQEQEQPTVDGKEDNSPHAAALATQLLSTTQRWHPKAAVGKVKWLKARLATHVVMSHLHAPSTSAGPFSRARESDAGAENDMVASVSEQEHHELRTSMREAVRALRVVDRGDPPTPAEACRKVPALIATNRFSTMTAAGHSMVSVRRWVRKGSGPKSATSENTNGQSAAMHSAHSGHSMRVRSGHQAQPAAVDGHQKRDTLWDVKHLRLPGPPGTCQFGRALQPPPRADVLDGADLHSTTLSAIDFLRRMALIPEWKRSAYRMVFDKLDKRRTGRLGPVHLCYGLKAVCRREVTHVDIDFVGEVLDLMHHATPSTRSEVDFEEFAIACALCERVVDVEPEVRRLMGSHELTRQKRKAIMAFFVDAGDDCRMALEDLGLLLDAGRVNSAQKQIILDHLSSEGDSITFLQYLAYLPLFLDIHTDIVHHTLDDERREFDSSP
mmetsp:Transcript_18837/g.55863  ORF Transcript_18837/g.55863 Transcript_18837/m.55863 type:complete len:813 (+) Transcript_18837:209-2647(+)